MVQKKGMSLGPSFEGGYTAEGEAIGKDISGILSLIMPIPCCHQAPSEDKTGLITRRTQVSALWGGGSVGSMSYEQYVPALWRCVGPGEHWLGGLGLHKETGTRL